MSGGTWTNKSTHAGSVTSSHSNLRAEIQGLGTKERSMVDLGLKETQRERGLPAGRPRRIQTHLLEGYKYPPLGHN